MEKVLTQVTETVEAAPALPVEPQGGFPWGGVGIGVVVVAVAVAVYKKCGCKK